MNKKKFVADNKTISLDEKRGTKAKIPLKKEPKFLAKNVKKTPEKEEIKSTRPKPSHLPNVNLDHLEVNSFLKEMVSNYHHGNDRGVIYNWLRRWRIESRTETVDRLLGLLKNIREHSENLQEYKIQLMSQADTSLFLSSFVLIVCTCWKRGFFVFTSTSNLHSTEAVGGIYLLVANR